MLVDPTKDVLRRLQRARRDLVAACKDGRRVARDVTQALTDAARAQKKIRRRHPRKDAPPGILS